MEIESTEGYCYERKLESDEGPMMKSLKCSSDGYLEVNEYKKKIIFKIVRF